MINADFTFGISKKSFSLLLSALQKYNEIEKAVIFGSRAMGNEKTGSDIDIAIYGAGVNNKLIVELKTILNEKMNIPYFVDLLEYKSISNMQLKDHIDKEGKILFNRNSKTGKYFVSIV